MAITPYLEALAAANPLGPQGLAELPRELADHAHNFPDLSLPRQVQLLDELAQAGYQPDAVLRAAALERKLAGGDFMGKRLDERFVDEEVRRLNRGQKVELIVEIPTDGVSRHQAAFFKELIPEVAHGGVIGVNAGMSEFRSMADIEGSESELPKDTRARVTNMLARFAVDGPDSSLFMDGPETEMHLLGSTPTGYGYQYVRGIVNERPEGRNEGMLRLTNGLEFEGTNVRVVMVVGADRNILLDRGKDEAYYGRPVRVWWQGWHKGRIVDLSHPSLVGVEADQPIHDNLDNPDGRGLSVGYQSFDLDYRDPASTAEAFHPLEMYRHIRAGNVVRYIDPDTQAPMLGVIDGISSANHQYGVIGGGRRFEAFAFEDASVRLVDSGEVAVQLPEGTVAQRDARFAIRELDGETTIYRIVGVDKEREMVLAKRATLYPGPPTIHEEMPLTMVSGVVSPEDAQASLDRFPGLTPDRPFRYWQVRFQHEGTMLAGELLTADTAPFYLQIIV